MDDLVLGGISVPPGVRTSIDLPVGNITSHAPVILPVQVIRGRRPGPCMLVTACLHGDELNGAEIIRRLLRSPSLKRLRGTLLAVPVLNLPAYLARTRYLPDRRDLNRCFPGAAAGSLGARLAKVITSELLPAADTVVDLHTGAVNRPNLPQIRVTARDHDAMRHAKTFEAPVIMVSALRQGSFRSACREAGVPVILFESGEAARLDASAIRFGMRGIKALMRSQGMLPAGKSKERPKPPPVVCLKSTWERAPSFGLFTPLVPLGRAVSPGDQLGFVADPLGTDEWQVKATLEGVVIGRTNEGLVDEGNALFHIAVPSAEIDVDEHIAESGDALPSLDPGDDHPVPHDPYSDL